MISCVSTLIAFLILEGIVWCVLQNMIGIVSNFTLLSFETYFLIDLIFLHQLFLTFL